MAKELPYFKFFVSEWILGRISDHSDKVQGAFINAICYYWHKNCDCFCVDFKRKLGKNRYDLLINLKFIEVENDKIFIRFLDEQFSELSDIHPKRVRAGQAGGIASAKAKEVAKAKHLDKDKIKEDKDKDNRFDFKLSLLDYGFLDNLVNEWLVIRKNKKASNTETAFNGFVSQVELTGLDKNEVLKTCVERSWSGLKAEWIKTNTQISKVDQLLIAHEEGKKLLGINEPTNENK